MPTLTLIVGMLLLTAGTLTGVWLLLTRQSVARVRGNLERGQPAAAVDATPELDAPREPRLFISATQLQRLEEYALGAGRRPDAVAAAVTAKYVLAAIAFVAAAALVIGTRSILALLLGVALVVLGWFGPEIFLHGRAEDRRKLIDAELANTLDQVTIAVEAGLGFEAALARIVRTGSGPLNDELIRTLQSMQLGLTRREAYEQLAVRVKLPDLERFVRAIIQADIYGVPVAQVLRVQSAEVRTRRRHRLEEQAMKIPVKVTLPLMLCLMPVLFIVVLGPVLINAFVG